MHKQTSSQADITYGLIENWNTTAITVMEKLFMDYKTFNKDIGNWNVENVTNMRAMFKNAYLFNGDISKWNVGAVENMGNMFTNAQNFNQDITDWDVKNVTLMNYMFHSANNFNQNVGKWEINSIGTHEGGSHAGLDGIFGPHTDHVIIGWTGYDQDNHTSADITSNSNWLTGLNSVNKLNIHTAWLGKNRSVWTMMGYRMDDSQHPQWTSYDG